MVELNTIKQNVVEALGNKPLTLERLEPKSGYEADGLWGLMISPLPKRVILRNGRPGYYVQPEYQWAGGKLPA